MTNKKSGFTLIELILYIAVSASLLLVITLFLATLLESRIKNNTIASVEQQGLHIMQVIGQTVRNSEAINSPAVGVTASSMSVDVVDASDDPTIFDVSSNTLRITEGAGSAVDLHNSQVLISDLNFENVSRADTSGIVKISFTLSHLNLEGRSEYNFSKTFYTSVALR